MDEKKEKVWYMRRRDAEKWKREAAGKNPGFLLLKNANKMLT